MHRGVRRAVPASPPGDAPEMLRPSPREWLHSGPRAAADGFGLHRGSAQNRFGSHSHVCILAACKSAHRASYLAGRSSIGWRAGSPWQAGTVRETPGRSLLPTARPRRLRARPRRVPCLSSSFNPAPGSVLATSPPSLMFEFNRPIDPDSVNNDVLIVPIGLGMDAMSPVLTQPFLDASATQLSLPSAPGNSPSLYPISFMSSWRAAGNR